MSETCVPTPNPLSHVAAVELFEPHVGEGEVRRVMQAVLHWAAIQDGHHSEKRTSGRHTYLSNVVVGLPENDRSGDGRAASMRVCYGWTRNLSASGVAVLVANALSPVGAIDRPGNLRVERVLPRGAVAALLLFNKQLQPMCLLARVARLRELPGNLTELGLVFLAKLENADHPVADMLLAAAEQFSTRLCWLEGPPQELAELPKAKR